MFKKRSKYNARRTKVDGITFASAREASRYKELRLLEKGKQIFNLVLQPKFPFVINSQPILTYYADFKYQDRDGCTIIEDAKGYKKDRVYRIKKKITEALYQIKIVEV